MAVDQKILDVLNLSELKSELPRDPKLVDIRVEDYVDTDGEDALRVWGILDESVEVENLRGEDVSAFKSAIRKRIRDQGVTCCGLTSLMQSRASSTRKTRNEPCTGSLGAGPEPGDARHQEAEAGEPASRRFRRPTISTVSRNHQDTTRLLLSVYD